MATFQLVSRTGHPDFLDLPWDEPLAAWGSDRMVDVARGISRHVVRFVTYDGAVYAVKEIGHALAGHEYRLLRSLAEAGLPVVEAVGVVDGRRAADGSPLDAALITRHLAFSLPYRYLFGGRGVADLRSRLLDALAVLLVRLHLEGFWWGDCSLSNTLFRRDAGALSAYLVDAETGELRADLSQGQRLHDLAIATENVAGEIMDLAAASRLPSDVDAAEAVAELERRYLGLWDEVTREEEFGAGERYRVDRRLERLNDMGFDVEELELVSSAGGDRLRLQPRVVELGHHRRRLRQLTGLDVQENQARRLLNDILGYRAHLERAEGVTLPEAVAAYRWLSEVYEPITAAIPGDQRSKLELAETFHEVLEHRWFLSEAAGADIGNAAALRSYLDSVLPFVPEEASVLPAAPDEEEGAGGAAG
ncbi:MAG: Chromosome segregation ATPases [uncultured Acidimicrobiales bacterium]|uniref:Chromosome segregation ATPases n=1 Tax=uncultured Acidimicrobiales bacterium TaxID=310071 RepID=A0A6J4IP25_9ACTN|nr:MAG: Chromosome segregation ATPases [uncultured Acidimicrobiales bacterium]